MHLKQLNLLNFKSYQQAEIDLHPKINCFVGNNGQGKTNLLDGIFYLSMCKSYFNSIDYLNIRHGEDFFVLQGVYERKGKEENVYCAVKKNLGKVFKRNGKQYERLADHIGLLPIVVVSPADSSLILDGSEERRRYMNGVISQFNKIYLDQVIRYNKLLANRNKLLKYKVQHSTTYSDLFDVLDEQLNELSKPIYEQRLEFSQKLTPIFEEYYRIVSNDAEKVELLYQSHLAENNLLTLLRESFERDKALQFTSKGIHKDDFILNLNGHQIKREGSQGQQKTYLIALKLAQFNFMRQVSGQKPILLLDDIFDKLDKKRVEQFIRLVAQDEFGQIFITDTNKARLDDILEKIGSGHSLFNVADGEVIKQRTL
jgi:DNA replication and repair protein RecF